MAEISNKALALLVLAALVVVVAATTIQLNKLNAIGITGLPTDDDGDVRLTIASNLEIITYEADLDFGTCTPFGAGVPLVIDSGVNRTSNGRCDVESNTGAEFNYIGVRNIGNIDAQINVSTAANPSVWITGTTTAPSFDAYFAETGDDCSGTLITTPTQLHNEDNWVACTSLDANGGQIQMYGVVSIPSDAVQSTSEDAVITFTASEV